MPPPQDLPTSKHNYTQVGLKGQHSLLFGSALNNHQMKIKGLNSPQLAQYVSSMPNSVKHSHQ